MHHKHICICGRTLALPQIMIEGHGHASADIFACCQTHALAIEVRGNWRKPIEVFSLFKRGTSKLDQLRASLLSSDHYRTRRSPKLDPFRCSPTKPGSPEKTERTERVPTFLHFGDQSCVLDSFGRIKSRFCKFTGKMPAHQCEDCPFHSSKQVNAGGRSSTWVAMESWLWHWFGIFFFFREKTLINIADCLRIWVFRHFISNWSMLL